MPVTKIKDINIYIVSFLDISDILSVCQLNKSTHNIISSLNIYPQIIHYLKKGSDKILNHSITYGHFELIKHLCTIGYTLNFKPKHINDAVELNIPNIIEVLNYIDQQRSTAINLNLVVKHNRLDILQWYSNIHKRPLKIIYDTIYDALCNNYFETITFCIQNQYCNDYVISNIIRGITVQGNQTVLEYFFNLDDKYKYIDDICCLASESGQLHILEWLDTLSIKYKYVFPHDVYSVDIACLMHHLDIIKWWKESTHGFLYTLDPTGTFPMYADEETIEWLTNY